MKNEYLVILTVLKFISMAVFKTCSPNDSEFVALVLLGVGLSSAGDMCIMGDYYPAGMLILIVARVIYCVAFSRKWHSPCLAVLPFLLCCLLLGVAQFKFKEVMVIIHVIVATIFSCLTFAAARDTSSVWNCSGSLMLMVANVVNAVSHDFGIPHVNIVSEIVSLTGHGAVMVSTFVDGHDTPTLPW